VLSPGAVAPFAEAISDSKCGGLFPGEVKSAALRHRLHGAGGCGRGHSLRDVRVGEAGSRRPREWATWERSPRVSLTARDRPQPAATWRDVDSASASE